MTEVTSRAEVIKNLYTLHNYCISNSEVEVEFAKSRFKRGWVFVAENVAGHFLFAPSKFVGYVNNNFHDYEQNKVPADGRDTNNALEVIYGKEKGNDYLLSQFKTLLNKLGVDRNFDTDKAIRFYYNEENINRKAFSSFFICPTHIKGAKPKAWNNFINNDLASIGWDLPDYTDWNLKEIETFIEEQGYEDKTDALIAHRNLFNMLPGDLVCCTNNNHGLFGIGIICSKRKYEEGIHNTGHDNGKDTYDHYVDVAWVKTDFIKQANIQKSSNETWWEPYGTLKVKSPIPEYIMKIVFKTQSKIEVDQPKANLMTALNTILYGPPGTGKTYNTVNKAISIINPDFKFQDDTGNEIERKLVVEEYARLVADERVAFTTFHQSMSYEDFIEGIKPQFKDTQMKYPVLPGIFKNICYEALKSMYHANIEQADEIDLDNIYQEFIQHLKDAYQPDNYLFKTKDNSELRLDKDEIENGRILVYYKWSNASTKDAPGKTPFPIKKDKLIQMYEDNVTDNESNIKARLKPILTYHLSPTYAVYKTFLHFVNDKVGAGSNNESLTSTPIEDNKDFEAYLEQLLILKNQRKELNKGKPYVLIIDEINRGNISQIFGELITLLEDDKRLGREEMLTIKLPYSKKDFAVPENLYIIGTLNTADRSVEALDTALRRRFSFEFMPPDYSLLSTNVSGIDLRVLLETINERIAYLLDQDHQIGHSYLMSIKDEAGLSAAFKNKIIPLLKEYFYNDIGKIRLVLGDGFVKKIDNHLPSFAVKTHTELNRDVYEIRSIGEAFEIASALKLVFGEQ